jgi:hypothetical protein
MYTYICFDVEDLVHPESDDVPRDIAEMLADDGVVTSMCVVGEKARLWERRGRRDVITAVGQHDVSLHTNRHSMHPTPSEYLADKGWCDGVAEAVRREEPGVRDLTRIFGAYPSTWGTPGSSWGPQIATATQQLGIPSNIYSHAEAGTTSACWFAGQLCFSEYVGLAGGEDACCDDAEFEVALPQLLQKVEEMRDRGALCLGLFAGHPTRFRYTIFWDQLNYSKGQNTAPDSYQFAPRRDDAAYAIGLRNLRRMLLAVRDLQGVQVVSVRSLNRRFALQTGSVPWCSLRQMAQSIVESTSITSSDAQASPAQKLDLLARAVVRQAGRDETPSHLLLRNVLGPTTSCRVLEHSVAVNPTTGFALCRELLRHVDTTGHLPAMLKVNGVEVGPGPFLRMVAVLFLMCDDGVPGGTVTLQPGAEEPANAGALVDGLYANLPGWPPHDPNLRLEQLALHTRLQSWSLKPAVLRE